MTADAPATTRPSDSPADAELDTLAAVIAARLASADVDTCTCDDCVAAAARVIAAEVLRHQATAERRLEPIPNWYIELSQLRFQPSTPTAVSDAIAEAVDYVMTLRTQRARILRLFDEATAEGKAAAEEARGHRDALAQLLLSADDSLTPQVDVQEVAALRQACRDARDVVNWADDKNAIGSGDAPMIRLGQSLAAVKL